ncbi:MAG: hypothetical protein V4808_13260 [Pseudomonadota bacterium]
MINPVADPPLRQLTRLRGEMAISSAQLTAAMFPDQPLLGVEFGVVARMCLADWAQSRSLARPTAPARTISIRQMAFSLGEAPETTRRHVNRLIERGAFVSSAQGVSLATTAENEALVIGYYLSVHDLPATSSKLFKNMVDALGLEPRTR